MTNVIDKKIVGYAVKPTTEAPKETLKETTTRPEALHGITYKIKAPTLDHALYITITDIVIDGRPHPYELFINSKDIDNYQWVAALTRIVSAVFRKGGEVAFLVDELKAIFDPKGGYYKKGTYVPSLVAEIGHILGKHLASSHYQ